MVRETSVEAWVEGENDPVAEGDEGERADVELITVRLSPPTTLSYLEEPSRAMMGGSGSDENVEGHGQSTPNSGLGLAQSGVRGAWHRSRRDSA